MKNVDFRDLWGASNIFFNQIEQQNPNLKIHFRGEFLNLQGKKKEIEEFERHFEVYLNKIKNAEYMSEGKVMEIFETGSKQETSTLQGQAIIHDSKGKTIKPKTDCQKKLLKSVYNNDIVFATGPAGTGKTFLATVLAVKYLKEKYLSKIILTRPVVEAGENLGFLPGDLNEKINPYLRPLSDALEEILGVQKTKHYFDTNVIEIAPLAYMRGRTLNNAFIIVDEAQNATNSQLKMLLTRLGKNIKCIVTGDVTQVDLPSRVNSGLATALKLFSDIEGIGFVNFQDSDIVRHPLVRKIINAYHHESS